MTETQTRPNLTITAVYAFNDEGPGSTVTYYFDRDFRVGTSTDTIDRLVAFWGMTREVATSVVNDLWNEATSEDSNGTAEVILSENGPEPIECEHEDLDHGRGWNGPVTCAYCGIEMQYDGDGTPETGNSREWYSPIA